MKTENILTNRDDWKLKLSINDCLFPEKMKHLRFTGEQYDDKGNVTNSSFYDFYLSHDEVINLANILLK